MLGADCLLALPTVTHLIHPLPSCLCQVLLFFTRYSSGVSLFLGDLVLSVCEPCWFGLLAGSGKVVWHV